MGRHCEEYLHYLLLEKNASKNTVASYRLDITRYLEYLRRTRVRNLDDITERHASRFVGALHDLGLSPQVDPPNNLCHQGFHRFLLGDGITQSDPTALMELRRRQGTFLMFSHRKEWA